jgi:hypothetical protein
VIDDSYSIDELQEDIVAAIPTLKIVGGYGHNVISACLRLIAKEHGKDAANKTIRELKLDKEGWSEQ